MAESPSTVEATGPAMTPDEFGAAVSAITDAFGDPTRRAVYLLVHAHPDGLTASAVADHFSVHPNVARHHLDKLAATGHLAVSAERVGGGAGRPSKVFRPAAPFIRLDVPVRHDEIITRLLGRALDRLGPTAAAELAAEVGVEYGRALAQSVPQPADSTASLRSSLHAVADALAAYGFGAHAETDGDTERIVADVCPFGEVALQNPVICAVDRGIVEGMLGAMYPGETAVAMRSSRGRGDEACVTDVAV